MIYQQSFAIYCCSTWSCTIWKNPTKSFVYFIFSFLWLSWRVNQTNPTCVCFPNTVWRKCFSTTVCWSCNVSLDQWKSLTISLVQHGLLALVLFIIIFVNQRRMREPERNKELRVRSSCRSTDMNHLQMNSDLWLLAEGRSSTIMTSRMVENRRRQKASSTHRFLQPCSDNEHSEERE